MRYFNKLSIIAVVGLGAVLSPTTAAGEYKLDLSRGKFPADIVVENLNDVIAQKNVYKRGWSAAGWNVERLDDRGYVAICPTYHPGETTESALSLPVVTIEKGMHLTWEGKSVYRHFPESYRVEAIETDGRVTNLAEVKDEEYGWKRHEADLSAFTGKEVSLRFVCTSSEGYMLAIDKVSADFSSGEEEEPASCVLGEFDKRYLVDHATGMWCNGCPASEGDIDKLKLKFGKRLIMLNTHVDDALGNDEYWKNLHWYNIPEMMLNRIRKSAGSNSAKFTEFYSQDAFFAISLAAGEPEGRILRLKANVKVAMDVENASDRYRLGYVVTGNFHDPGNEKFLQVNNCTLPSEGAFYFLPTRIIPALMYYDDVTLTEESAFTGMESSLPSSMTQDEVYTVEWNINVPELLENPTDARVVVFVIDTESGEIMNSAEIHPGEDEMSGVKGIPVIINHTPIWMNGGSLCFDAEPGLLYRLDVYTPDGKGVYSAELSGEDRIMHPLGLDKGYYIIRLMTPAGVQTCKILLN